MTPDAESALTTIREAEGHTAHESCLTWLVAATVGTLAATLAAAHAPPQARKLLLFFLICDLVLVEGYLLLQRTTGCQMRRRMFVGICSCLLLAFQVGVTLETHRWQKKLILQPGDADSRASTSQKALIPDINRQAKGDRNTLTAPTPEMLERQQLQREFDDLLARAMNDEQNERLRRATLGAYLQRRIQAMGNWSPLSALAIWLTEILLATAVAACFLWHRTNPVPEGDDQTPAVNPTKS